MFIWKLRIGKIRIGKIDSCIKIELEDELPMK